MIYIKKTQETSCKSRARVQVINLVKTKTIVMMGIKAGKVRNTIKKLPEMMRPEEIEIIDMAILKGQDPDSFRLFSIFKPKI